MDFPANSHKAISKATMPPKEEVQKVVTGKVIKRSVPLGRRFKELFFGGETKGVLQYIFGDVILPSVKNMIVDSTSRGIERAMYGDKAVRRSGIGFGQPKISYNLPVERFPRDVAGILPKQAPQPSQSRHSAGEILFTTRADAEEVLERLTDLVENYQAATVSDLYSLVGYPTTFVDEKWGWTSVASVTIQQVRDGYILSLPSASAL